MLLFSHPTGNANVRHAALGLLADDLLSAYHTCLAPKPDSFALKLLPAGLRRQFARRSLPPELAAVAHTHPTRELARMLAPKLRLSSLVRHETGRFSVDAVYQNLDQSLAKLLTQNPKKFRAVYAYEDGAAHHFRAARSLGLTTLYDLPIGYWRSARDILVEEGERKPEWASTLIGNDDSPAKTSRKDEELALADQIYVASSFTRDSLARYPTQLRAPITVIPYGAPHRPPGAPSSLDTARRPGPLRAIFVGSLGQRKGLSYLFDAARLLGPDKLQLTIIGSRPLRPCPALDAELARVRWIESLPHAQVLAEMAAHDVFVFPSLFEGFGLVLLEAMAMGLPIVATPHTAAPDLITDGQEGFIVPIRSAEAIAAALDKLTDLDRCREMGRRAQTRSREFTWDNYSTRLAAHVREACQPAPPKR